VNDILDREDELRSRDPQDLLDAYLRVAGQLESSFRVATASGVAAGSVDSVAFCAMGGSAAAGDIAEAALAETAPLPIRTLRGYRLPAHLGKGSLVVCLSYSGNTEETLAAYAEARSRGCRVVAVSAAGELASRAAIDGIPHVELAGDCPQPRAALGHLTGAALGVLTAAGVVPGQDVEVQEAVAHVSAQAAGLAPSVPTRSNPAKQLAGWLGERFPVVWGSEGVSGAAAWRWKCAFNENAKIPAFASELPELDHHEVAGWSAGTGERFALIVLREAGEHPSIDARLEATLDQVRRSGIEVREVRALGHSPLARAISLMLLGDVASTYHAMARGIDPAPIEAISKVKARLAREAPWATGTR
jgi:glucose/mannose-6-phosphate isomerase